MKSKKPLQSSEQANQQRNPIIPNSQTYIHYNSSAQINNSSSQKDLTIPGNCSGEGLGGGQMRQSTSMNFISSPTTLQQYQQQKQQQQSQQHNAISRQNSVTNTGYYNVMSNTSITSYAAPSTPQQQSKNNNI